MSAVLSLTQELISIPSITPEDNGCLDLLAARLKKLGFQIEFFPCKGANNLWARRGTMEPLFCFAGHIDVVPTGPIEQWQSDPFTPTLRHGFLYGRGAADMKSAVAAFIVAIENFLQQHAKHKGSIALLLTSAEEGPCELGTPIVMNALAARKEKITYCLVGEPSSSNTVGDVIKNGRRGSLNGQLTVHGKQGHIAYPQLADNPIYSAVNVIASLNKVHWDNGNEDFQATQLHFSNLHAGTGSNNVIPAQLSCKFNFRFSPQSSAESLQQRFETILHEHNLKFTLIWELSGQPFITSAGRLITVCREIIREQLNLETILSTDGGTSDGRFIACTGAEVVELGVCNASIHQIDECVKIEDLEKLAILYQEIVTKLLT